MKAILMDPLREYIGTIDDTIVTVHDSEFNIVGANDAAKKVLKLPALNRRGIKCYHYFHGSDCPPQRCPASEHIVTGDRDVIDYFEPHLNRCIAIRLSPRFDRDGGYAGLMRYVRDITNTCTILGKRCE